MAFAELRRDSTATTDRSDTLSPLTAQKQGIIVSIRYFDRLSAKLLLTNQIHRFSSDIWGTRNKFVRSRFVLPRAGRVFENPQQPTSPCENVEPGNSEKMLGAERAGHSVRTHKNVHTYSSRLAHAPAQKSAEGRRIEGPSLMMTPGFQDPVRPFRSTFRGRRVTGVESVDLLREPFLKKKSSYGPDHSPLNGKTTTDYGRPHES